MTEEQTGNSVTVVTLSDSSGGTLSGGISTEPGQAQGLYFSPELPQNPFGLAGTALTVTQPDLLDRETRGFYTLPVIATGSMAYATVSDNPLFTGLFESLYHIQVTVRVMDVNDNRPQLQLPALLFTVPENISEPVYITTAVANDDDTGIDFNRQPYKNFFYIYFSYNYFSTGNNADIQFSFTVTSDNFSINGSTGEVTTLRELDREEMDVHQLTIQVPQFPLIPVTNYYSTIHLFQATDGMFSEEGTITVTVADVNDNPPVFGRDSYSVAVLENRPRGTSTLAGLD